MPKYFKAVDGHIVARFGSATMIAATLARKPPKPGVPGPGKVIGWKQDLSRVVLIPDLEVRKYRREYINAVRRGDLVEATEAEYNQSVADASAATVPAAGAAPVGGQDAPAPDSTPTGPSSDEAPAQADPRTEEVVLDAPPKVESEPKASKPARKRRRKSS